MAVKKNIVMKLSENDMIANAIACVESENQDSIGTCGDLNGSRFMFKMEDGTLFIVVYEGYPIVDRRFLFEGDEEFIPTCIKCFRTMSKDELESFADSFWGKGWENMRNTQSFNSMDGVKIWSRFREYYYNGWMD